MAGSFSDDELVRLRRDTPACGRYAHFAHGSASLPPLPVFEAQQAWLDSERRLGSHRAVELHGDALSDVKASVGRLINAQPHQIALLDSASHAWSTAMGALLESARPVHVIATDLEYGANAIFILSAAEQQRLSYSLLKTERLAALPTEALDRLLEDVPSGVTPVVCIALVSTAWGVEVALGDVARKVHAKGGLLFLDASHAVGQLPIDVATLECDVLVFPSRKWLRGPKGLGVLFVSDFALGRFGVPVAPDVAGAQWVDASHVKVHQDARRFDGYEFNPGLHLALRAACDYAVSVGVARIALQNRQIREGVATAIRDKVGWEALEVGQSGATALMTYRLPDTGLGDETFLRRLWAAAVNVSLVGRQHALWALESAGAGSLLRLTPHYVTAQDEISQLVNAIDISAA